MQLTFEMEMLISTTINADRQTNIEKNHKNIIKETLHI